MIYVYFRWKWIFFMKRIFFSIQHSFQPSFENYFITFTHVQSKRRSLTKQKNWNWKFNENLMKTHKFTLFYSIKNNKVLVFSYVSYFTSLVAVLEESLENEWNRIEIKNEWKSVSEFFFSFLRFLPVFFMKIFSFRLSLTNKKNFTFFYHILSVCF